MFLETLVKVLEYIVGILVIKDLKLQLIVSALMQMMPTPKKIVEDMSNGSYSRED